MSSVAVTRPAAGALRPWSNQRSGHGKRGGAPCRAPSGAKSGRCLFDPSRRRDRVGQHYGKRWEGHTMSIASTRRLLYQLARLLGDASAVQKGKVGRRVARRAAGRLTGRGLGRLFR